MHFPIVVQDSLLSSTTANGTWALSVYAGWAYIPVKGWLELTKEHPRMRPTKSAIEIRTRTCTYWVHPLPSRSQHYEALEVYPVGGVPTPENEQLGMNECILGRIVEPIQPTESLIVQATKSDSQKFQCQLLKMLAGQIVIDGLVLARDEGQTIVVARAEPSGEISIVGPNTRLIVRVESPQPTVFPSDFVDAGAYEQLKELVIAARSLRSPGIGIPRGVLLHGPPGVGKTHLVRKLVDHLQVPLVVINGPEVISGEFGGSEANLRRAFLEAAERAGSLGMGGAAILFIDEVDSIGPKREESLDQEQVRLVTQLARQMDVAPRNLLIIGATNRPNAIDGSLRRPGRFDREILVEPPDSVLRERILRDYLGALHLTQNLSLKLLAQHTAGYVPADLAALARELVLMAMAKKEQDPRTPTITLAMDNKLVIESSMVEEALAAVGPSIKREYRVNVETNLSWTDIGGMDQIKEQLQRAVQWPIVHAERYHKLGLRAPRGILLYGPPGCSKTMIAKVLAHTAGLNFYSLSGAAIYSAYVGEAEQLVRQVFAAARLTAPSLIFFDEVDALVGNRAANSGDLVQERILSTLLNEMDGVEEAGRITVLGATNRKDAIDAALLRPGRFDLLIEVPLPDRDSRIAILQTVSRGTPLAPDVQMDRLANDTVDWSGARLKALVQEAALLAIRQGDIQVNMGHLEMCLGTIKDD